MSVPAEKNRAADLQRWDGHVAVIRDVVALHAGQTASPLMASQARRLLLDTVGCAVAGRHAAEVRRLELLLSGLGAGAFALPRGPALDVYSAAQVFSMSATWDEACEGHAFAHGRPGVALIAALLPLAVHRKSTLVQLVDALVLGYEVGARAGGWLRVRPGMHVDANWPSLGVAAGVARLLDLPVAGIVQAIDIAACQLATSLYLPVKTGNTARNTFLAHSAMLGLQAAFASAAGVDAPVDALAHYAHSHAQAVQAPLPGAAELLMMDGYLKPYAAVRHVHYGAAAAGLLRPRLTDTSGVTGIDLQVYEEAMVYCGNRSPSTPIQAQFSLSFGVAAMLRYGDIDPSVYASPRFEDPELQRLESIVVLRRDDALTAANQRGATVTVHHAGEALQASVEGITGDAASPLDNAAVRAKFIHYASTGLSPYSAAGFCDAILDGPDSSVLTLWQLLGADARDSVFPSWPQAPAQRTGASINQGNP